MRLINNNQAHSTLQMCYAKGEGVPQNYQEARRLFALASAQGDADATEALRRVRRAMNEAQSDEAMQAVGDSFLEGLDLGGPGSGGGGGGRGGGGGGGGKSKPGKGKGKGKRKGKTK